MSEREPYDKTLHVMWSAFENEAHIVSSKTLAAAEAANAAPELLDFGDLRRHGELEELQYRLERHGEGNIDDYVAAIERSAGRQPGIDELGDRLAALADVTFDGVPEDVCDPEGLYRYLPADDVDFRDDWQIEEAPEAEFRGYFDIISKAMSSDIPHDLFDEFGHSRYGDSPAYAGHIDDHVSADQLDALIAALTARGYTVIQD